MDAFLRARGTPISVLQLEHECPLPVGITGKFIDALASDERFELQDLGRLVPMVQMRETPPEAETSPTAEAAAPSVTVDPEAMTTWLSR